MPKHKPKQQQLVAVSENQNRNPRPPDWPSLSPLVPTPSLSLEPLLPQQVYLIHNLLTSSLCRTFVSFFEKLPLITTPGKPKRGHAVRVNDRFQVEDPLFAEILWTKTALRELITTSPDIGAEGKRAMSEIWGGEPLGLNANIRVYRYSPGQFFARHYDDTNTLMFPSSPPQPARTTWTLLIYLSTCTGGETVFYPEATREARNPESVSVSPQVGLALLHRHGERCLPHEGKEVTGGEKWILRSDLVVGR